MSCIETLAAAAHAACLRDLPCLHYEDRDWEKYRAWKDSLKRDGRNPLTSPIEPAECRVQKSRQPRLDECEVIMFPQTWSSTALGYGGLGGKAITEAYTVVVIGPTGDAAVYFGGGRLAYVVNHSIVGSAPFHEVLARRTMPSVQDANKLGWIAGANGAS